MCGLDHGKKNIGLEKRRFNAVYFPAIAKVLMHQCALQLSFIRSHNESAARSVLNMDLGLRTTDYGLGIKHGLKYKTRTEV